MGLASLPATLEIIARGFYCQEIDVGTMDIKGSGRLNTNGNAQKRLAAHLIVADLTVSDNRQLSVDVSNSILPIRA